MLPEARQEKLLVEEIGDELIIYDEERDRVHRLNRTAAWIWRRCDGRTSVEEVAALLPRELGLPADEDVIELALRQLDKIHLLRTPVPPRTGEAKLMRRDMVRKLGLAGAMAFMMPIVTSMTAPTPAMAQYPPPPDRTCFDQFEECVAGCPDEFFANIECVTFNCAPRFAECRSR